MDDLEKRVERLEARNRRVEADKAWETSWIRRLLISSLTYLIVLCYLSVIGAEHPLLAAIVPALGFLLSTMVLRRVKAAWQHRRAA